MKFIYDDKQITQFSVFNEGYDRSHCGSCRESGDETIGVLITTATLEEMAEKLKKYLSYDRSEFCYIEFLKWVNGEATLYEDDTIDKDYNIPYLEHISIFFEKEGISYCPEILLSHTCLPEYTCSKDLKNLIDKKYWDERMQFYHELATKREKEKQIAKQYDSEVNKKIEKYESDKKNFLKLVKLKEELGGTKHIPPPEKPDFSEYLKYIKENPFSLNLSLKTKINKINKEEL